MTIAVVRLIVSPLRKLPNDLIVMACLMNVAREYVLRSVKDYSPRGFQV
jgi:hypothetical protein